MRFSDSKQIISISASLTPTMTTPTSIYTVSDGTNFLPTQLISGQGKLWTNTQIEALYATCRLALPEAPLPQFSLGESRESKAEKARAIEWSGPRIHLNMYKKSKQTLAGVGSDPIWNFLGIVALTANYGYPYRKYRLLPFITDAGIRGLQQGDSLGLALEYVNEVVYIILGIPFSQVSNPGGTITTTFQSSVRLDATRIASWQLIDGSILPYLPESYAFNNGILTVTFVTLAAIAPYSIRAGIETSTKRTLQANETIDIDGTAVETYELAEADYSPTPIITQGPATISTKTIARIDTTARPTRSNPLLSRPTRLSGSLTNTHASNSFYYQWGSTVSTTTFNGVLGPGSVVQLPTGYTGVVSVCTATTVVQCTLTTEETYTETTT
jgi:hypothetical protein